jgi:hypothetical protein
MTIPETVKAARRVSVPIVAITTADQPATIASIVRSYNGTPPPMLQHDLIRGIQALNDAGKAARAAIVPPDDGLGAVVPGQNPAEALSMAANLPERSLLFVINAHLGIDNEAVRQAICNLRDLFKADGRTLVLLAPAIILPAELVQDVFVVDEPLPTEEAVKIIIQTELTNAKQSMKKPPNDPDASTLQRSIEALSGLAAFPIEQAVAMSLAAGSLDVDQLWARKRGFIEQTRGLSIDRNGETFADLGGLEQAKLFGRRLFAGNNPPRCIVRIDEIEKMLGGAAGDTSGVSQDALGTILREMEDQNWAGVIAVGPPGSGKSAFSKTLGRTHGAPTFALDLGAAKGSLVGQSEERIRAAMKVIKAVAGGGAFFVATCNKLETLAPELRRRFRFGLWFFDLPKRAEREAIWTICLRKFGLPADGERPADKGWTGAEIRNVCELASRMRCSLVDAACFIVPVAVSDPESILRLRKMAAGRFLSASYPGAYVQPEEKPTPAAGRAYNVGE